MKTTLSIKILLLIWLAVCTWSLTRSLLAQNGPIRKQDAPHKNRAATQAEGGNRETTITTTGATEPREPEPPGPGARRGRSIATFRLPRMDVAVAGDQVAVSATATMRDTRRGMAYMWELTAKDKISKERKYQNQYKNQIFRIHDDLIYQPTFDEQFRLPPGSYVVELAIYAIPPNVDVGGFIDAELNSEERKGFHRLCRDNRPISVPQ